MPLVIYFHTLKLWFFPHTRVFMSLSLTQVFLFHLKASCTQTYLPFPLLPQNLNQCFWYWHLQLLSLSSLVLSVTPKYFSFVLYLLIAFSSCRLPSTFTEYWIHRLDHLRSESLSPHGPLILVLSPKWVRGM